MSALSIRIAATAVLLLWAQTSTTSADTCTFENGHCDQWVSSDCSQGACFEVRKVSDMKHGPTVDHTTHTEEGSCGYATTGTTGGSPVATLAHKAQGPLCFTAWYHQFGTDIRPVFFSILSDKGMCSDFYASQPEAGGRWHRVRYSEKHTGNVEIHLRFHVSNSLEKGVLAVDDLTVESGECPPEPKDGSCDFDWGETCGYSFGENGTLWKLENRQEGSSLRDYSSGGMLGGFAYLEASGKHPAENILKAPKLPGRADVQCLHFKYYISESASTAKNDYLLKVALAAGREAHQPIWQRSSKELIRGVWTAADAVFKEERNFNMSFICSTRPENKGERSFCAIDDIRLDDCKGKRSQGDRSCDFEDGWCTWMNRHCAANKFTWLLAGGDVKTTLARPNQDKTLGNASGSYLLLSNHERNDGDKADLIGEILAKHFMLKQCLTFWSIVSGDEDTSLQVLTTDPMRASRADVRLWTVRGGGQVSWVMGRVAAPAATRPIFRGIVGSASKSAYIALDDITVSESDWCDILPRGADALDVGELLSCKFDKGDLCHWTSEGGPSGGWILGPPMNSTLGPLQPPYGTEGGMIHINGSALVKNGGSLRLFSPRIGRQAAACFSVWFHMFGARGVHMKLSINKTDTAEGWHWHLFPLLERVGRTATDRWYNVRRTVSSLHGRHHEFVFDLKITDESQDAAVVALGPLDFNIGACDVLTDAKRYCDFEVDLCGWVATKGWSVKTILHSFFDRDPHLHSGPITSEYGLVTNQYSCPKSNCTVKSPMWTGQSGAQCLEFWYLPAENEDAHLQAEVLANGKSKVLWSSSVHSDREWTLVRVQFVQQDDYEVVFRAVLPVEDYRSLAVDDVSLRLQPCVHLVECNFTDGFCGYINKFTDEFRWLVGKGRLENPSLKPNVPIPTDQSSSFAYLDLTAGRKTDRLVPKTLLAKTVGLLSSPFDITDDKMKIVVQYFRNGPDIVAAKLSVVCYGRGASVEGETQYSRELDEVSKWTALDVPLKRGKNCRLAVEVTRGEGTNGAMAVDSIQHTSEWRTSPSEDATTSAATSTAPSPLTPKPSVECSRGQFSCRDGATCIPAVLQCDGVQDCPNGLDENCGSADKCQENEFFCAGETSPSCLPRSLLCDGQDDCFGGADEFLCGVCPDRLCLNGGSCTWTYYGRSPVCNCSEGYAGTRCQLISKPARGKEAVTGSSATTPIVTSIVAVSAVAVIGALLAFLLLRRRAQHRRSEMVFSAAAYDASMQETHFAN
ncbi:MAM and LDL-receptor class A domain-containing protein 1-like isoform X2 [Amblyomma americanum]